MRKKTNSQTKSRRIVHLPARKKTSAQQPIFNPAIHTAVSKKDAVSAYFRSVPHTSLHIPVPAHVKPSVQIPVSVHKTTYTRKDLPDGDFMMNYYYRRDEKGELVPEDIESATHFERVVYDRNGCVIGSTMGTLNDTVRW